MLVKRLSMKHLQEDVIVIEEISGVTDEHDAVDVVGAMAYVMT